MIELLAASTILVNLFDNPIDAAILTIFLASIALIFDIIMGAKD